VGGGGLLSWCAIGFCDLYVMDSYMSEHGIVHALANVRELLTCK
jgi:hypothetical protein